MEKGTNLIPSICGGILILLGIAGNLLVVIVEWKNLAHVSVIAV
jgi:hypothetical protein